MYHFDFQVSRVWKIVSFTPKMEKKKSPQLSVLQNQQEDTNHQARHYKMQIEITEIHESPPILGGGYLVERWVQRCAAQIGCFFGLSGLPMAPFLFENWFRYRSHFAKCKIVNEFFLWFTYRLSKSTYVSQFT